MRDAPNSPNRSDRSNQRFLELPAQRVLGVPIHAVAMGEALAACDAAVAQGPALCVSVVNAAKLVRMRSDALLRESVLSSQLVLADGMAVVWASRVLGEGLPERVTGIDLFERLLDRAEQNGYGVYFLGATDDVLQAMIDALRVRHPHLRVVGSHSGYFAEDEEKEIAAAIRRSEADLLFVGISSPKKELFLARHFEDLGVRVCHGVGGSFDVLAGKTQRAPASWQRLGLEWLYRLLQEPRRMWRRYLVTNSIFLVLVAREWLRQRVGRRA